MERKDFHAFMDVLTTVFIFAGVFVAALLLFFGVIEWWFYDTREFLTAAPGVLLAFVAVAAPCWLITKLLEE